MNRNKAVDSIHGKSLNCATIESINFKMSYQDFKYILNSEQMNELREDIKEYIKKLSGSQLDNIKKLITSL